MTVLVAAAMAAAAPAWAGPAAKSAGLSKQDRNRLVDHLKKTKKDLEKATKGLSEAQWNFKPAPERWSIAQCYEHIAAAEDFLYDLVNGRVVKTPAQPEKKDPAKQQATDAQVLKLIPDRTNRVQAPEPLQPTNRYGSYEGSRKHFTESRKRTIDFVRKTEVDLRAHFMDSPVIKNMDAYDWVLFLSAHSQRHTAQILEVKADPNFPKK